METYEVRYTVYQGNSSQVVTESTMPVTVSNGGRHYAEQQVKSMFGTGGNHVVIQSVIFKGNR